MPRIRTSNFGAAVTFVALFLSLFSATESHSVENYALRGNWHEDEKCRSPGYSSQDDPWHIGSFLTTPEPEGNIIDGIGNLAITQYEFGCILTDPKLAIGNKVIFRAICGGESEKQSRGQLSFQFLGPDKMTVTFPFLVAGSAGVRNSRILTLFKCSTAKSAGDNLHDR